MELKIKYSQDGLISMTKIDGQSFVLSTQESWDFAENIFNEFVGKIDSEQLPPRITITKNGVEFKVIVSTYYNFWKRLESGKWEPHTFNIFDKFIKKNYTYIDIGAWIGPTVLYGYQLAKATYAFEPDPLAFKELNSNIQANSKSEKISQLKVFNKAITSKAGKINIGSKGLGGDSMSSVLFSNSNINWEVETVKLDEFLESNNIRGGIFIKIDIEGGEYELIPSLKDVFTKFDIVLYLSLHPYFLMENLRNNKSEGFIRKVFRRIKFSICHYKLIRSLPFRYFYTQEGTPINKYDLMLSAFFKGHIINEVLAINTKWGHS